jgi:hypothetical protein
MNWFDILKVEDEFTPFEEWAKSLTIGSDDPIMNPFRGMASHLQETVNNLIEHGRAQRAGEGRANALRVLMDAYGSQVRAFLEEKTPEAHQKGREWLESVVNISPYAQLSGNMVVLKPDWLSVADNSVKLLLRTCVDPDLGEWYVENTEALITQISLNYESLEVFYEIGVEKLEVCLYRNLLPSGDQLGFLVLAAKSVESWLKVWGE